MGLLKGWEQRETETLDSDGGDLRRPQTKCRQACRSSPTDSASEFPSKRGAHGGPGGSAPQRV